MYWMTIELCEGKRVRDPKTNWVLEVGKPYKVEKNQFWFRRMEAGDVKLFEEKPVEKPVKKADSSVKEKASEKPMEKPKAKRGKKKKSGVE